MRPCGPWHEGIWVPTTRGRRSLLACSARWFAKRGRSIDRGTHREANGVSEAELRGRTTDMEPVVEELSEAESLRLIGQAQIGRIGFTGRFGPVVLPVNFKLVDGAVIFRAEEYGHIAEDLRTGITGAEYKVAFEVDQTDAA